MFCIADSVELEGKELASTEVFKTVNNVISYLCVMVDFLQSLARAFAFFFKAFPFLLVELSNAC